MPKIGIVLKNIAAKLGLDQNMPEFAELEKMDIEIPEAVANAFQMAAVFSEESAKNNPKLKAHFYRAALDGADARIMGLMDEYGLADDARAEITGNQSTYDKIALLTKKVAAAKEMRDGATGNDKTALTTQINDLNAQLAAAKREKEAVAAEVETAVSQKYEERIKNSLINSKLATRKLDTSRFPVEMMQKLAYDYMVNALKDKGAVVVNDNDSLKLKQSTDAALDYYHNNQPVNFDDFLDEVLANNKLLAVNDQPPAPGVNGSQRNTYTSPANPAGAPRPNTGSTLSKLDQALADYEMGSRK